MTNILKISKIKKKGLKENKGLSSKYLLEIKKGIINAG